MSQDPVFHHRSLEDRESLAAYLEALRQGFESGSLVFSDEGGPSSFHPGGLVDFEIRVHQDTGSSELNLRFRWRDREQDNGSDGESHA